MVNRFRAIPTCLRHTNANFQFVILLICSTAVPGSCSCRTLFKAKAVPAPCPTQNPKTFQIQRLFPYFLFFFFLSTLADIAGSVEMQGRVSSLSGFPSQTTTVTSCSGGRMSPCFDALPWFPLLSLGHVTMLQIPVASNEVFLVF